MPDMHTGMLRLYPKGELIQLLYDPPTLIEEVVDISPRLERAVLFKSEEMMH